jgi:uncharacterized protein YndB with AHSA1/START domain
MEIQRSSMKRVALVLTLAAPLAHAEVKESNADAFFLTYSTTVAAPTSTAYADLVQVSRWWDGEDTYSGKAANLSIKPEAGGCFCEKWKDGSAEHGRVLMAIPGKVLRIETALGPLQERALYGVLTFWLNNADSTTTLTVEYRVNGAAASALDQLAPSVDTVLGAQVDRLRRFIATGNPEAPAAEKAAAAVASAKADDMAKDDDMAARVDELRREIQGGSNMPAKGAGEKPPPRPPDVPTPIPTKPPEKP